MLSALEIWQMILVASPFVALVAGKAIRHALSGRARLACGLGALAVLLLGLTPLSLPGVLADQVVLGLAYVVLWLALGSARPLVRYGTAGLYGVMLAVVFFTWRGLPLTWALGDATEMPFREVRLDCHHTIRMAGYGWVAHSGTEVIAVTRPLGLPVEVELGRHRFDDLEYEPAGLSARTVREGTKCAVAVTYQGQEVWRVPR